MFKGQSPQERSLLRRELSLSNYSSCCCWTFPLLLLSDCCCLILKSTADMRLAIWKSKPPCKVWQLIVSATMLRTSPGDCEHTKFSQGKLGALSVTRGLCASPLNPPLEQGSSQQCLCPFPVLALCPAMSCNPQKAQPAQSLLPNRPVLPGTECAAGLGQEPWPSWVGTHTDTDPVPSQGVCGCSTGSSPAMQHSCPSSSGVRLRGTSKEMQLPEASASQSIWRTQCARPKSFCAGSCISFNCNCFKFLSCLETWGPTH